MKSIMLLKELGKYPLFTPNDIAKIVNKSPTYIRTLLYRLHRQNLIQRIEKGKYTVYDDPLVYATYLITPSYLSLWTALRMYNLTEQQPRAVFVMVPKKRKNIKSQTVDIIFTSTKHMFGFRKERYADFDIFIAEREKAIIDALLNKLPLEDIKAALESPETDGKKLAEFAARTHNISLIKRLGYLLEQIKGDSFGLKALDRNYIPLNYFGKRKGKRDKKWFLILNASI